MITSCGGTSKETVLRSTFLEIKIQRLEEDQILSQIVNQKCVGPENDSAFPPVSVNAGNDKEYAGALGSPWVR